MGVVGQVSQDLFGAAKRALQIEAPVLFIEGSNALERGDPGQRNSCASARRPAINLPRKEAAIAEDLRPAADERGNGGNGEAAGFDARAATQEERRRLRAEKWNETRRLRRAEAKAAGRVAG